MAALVCLIVAAVCFLLALFEIPVGIDLGILGLFFVTLAMIFGHLPVGSWRVNRPS